MSRGVANLIFVLLYYLISIGITAGSKNTVIFFDVGQGDSIGIFHDNSTVLIDLGKNYQTLYQYAKLKFNPFCKVDAVFLSHLDADHAGGLERFSMFCHINKLYLGTASYINHENEAKIEKIVSMANISQTQPLSGGEVILLGSVKYSILSPERGDQGLTENSRSLIILVSKAETAFLMTGDAEIPQLEKVREVRFDQLTSFAHIVYKVPHHGSINNFDKDFGRVVKPQFCIVSVGKNNYGHPSSEVLTKLDADGCKVMRTDQLGNIHFNL